MSGGTAEGAPDAVLTDAQRLDYRRIEYQCYDKIGFPGVSPAWRSNRIVVNGSGVTVAESSFVLLLRLAVELKEGKGGWVSVHELEQEGFPLSTTDYRPWVKLRRELRGFLLDPDAKKLIENNKSGAYRISTHPDFVTYDKEKLLSHPNGRIKDLARALP